MSEPLREPTDEERAFWARHLEPRERLLWAGHPVLFLGLPGGWNINHFVMMAVALWGGGLISLPFIVILGSKVGVDFERAIPLFPFIWIACVSILWARHVRKKKNEWSERDFGDITAGDTVQYAITDKRAQIALPSQPGTPRKRDLTIEVQLEHCTLGDPGTIYFEKPPPLYWTRVIGATVFETHKEFNPLTIFYGPNLFKFVRIPNSNAVFRLLEDVKRGAA